MNKVLTYYLLSIFMLANGALFTWLFQGTPFAMWRQLIWIIGLIILYKTIIYVDIINIKSILNILSVIFIINVFQALYAIAVFDFNLVRIGYGFWIYFSGIPFLLFPYFFIEYTKTTGKSSLLFLDLFIYMGMFLTLGLIVDRISGGIFTKLFLISMSNELLGLLDSGRYCFLCEAPTTFGVYYCFCMFCTLYRLYLSESNKSKLLLLVISLSYIVGGWMTGSRQIVLVLGIVFVIIFGFYTLFINDRKSYITFGIVLLFLSAPYIESFLYSDKAYKERFSSSSVAKDKRSQYWEEGFKENVSDNILIFYLGKAFSLSQGQKAKKGELTGRHYENTFYSRISEVGIIGVFLLLVPLYYLLRHWDGFDMFNIGLLSIYLSYLLISYIAPNGSHQTTQMVVFIAMGMNLIKHEFTRDKMQLA